MERLKASMAVSLCLILSLPSVSPAQANSTHASHTSARRPYRSSQLRGDQRILYGLDRFTFGPRPGDLERVRSMGLENWFAQQLHPETIDDSALEARLNQFPALQWSVQDLLYRLPSNGMIRQAIEGKVPVPQAGSLHAVYSDQMARIEHRQALKAMKQQAAQVDPGQTQANAGSMIAPPDATDLEPPPSEAQIEQILALAPPRRVSRLVAMTQPEIDSFRKALRGPQRMALTEGLDPAQKELVGALESPQRVVDEELAAVRLTRDIESDAQLQEVMTDFWLNHFNIYLHKNDETPYYLASYERDVIRPRALGKFEDLLEATAHSPAMLFYLDNSSSTGPDSPAAASAAIAAARHPDAKKQAPRGLNENYARELMELHTLGVNGGYTQADVTQVARVFTGWTVDRPQRGGGFKFDTSRHEPGNKKVMGLEIKESGEQEGVELLHLLATRPAAARFIARKLAIRFVSDHPPQSLVDRMARTFLSHHGDISAVLLTLFHSPEFWAESNYGAKVKTPIEYVASAARASNAGLDNLQPLVNALREMGMPLYGAVPPTGYKWDAADWVSTGALVNRMNFALTLAANRLPGVVISWSPQSDLHPTDPPAARIDDSTATRSLAQPGGLSATAASIPGPEAEERRLEALLVPDGVSATTRAAVLEEFNAQSALNQSSSKTIAASARILNPQRAASALERQDELLAGLLLGSPEFQRR